MAGSSSRSAAAANLTAAARARSPHADEIASAIAISGRQLSPLRPAQFVRHRRIVELHRRAPMAHVQINRVEIGHRRGVGAVEPLQRPVVVLLHADDDAAAHERRRHEANPRQRHRREHRERDRRVLDHSIDGATPAIAAVEHRAQHVLVLARQVEIVDLVEQHGRAQLADAMVQHRRR